MTYIEFFDASSVENVVSCLAQPPEKVYLLGGDPIALEKACRLYEEIFGERGVNVDFLAGVIRKPEQLSSIVEALTDVLEKESDCCIDLTGGSDLCLVAIGVAAERYKDRGLQMHRFNLREHRVVDCDGDGNVISDVPAPRLSVEEYIRVYGGRMLKENEAPGGTAAWDLTKDGFADDIETMWQISRGKHPYQAQQNQKFRRDASKTKAFREWNRHIRILAALEGFVKTESLTTRLPYDIVCSHLRDDDGKDVSFSPNKLIAEPLKREGLCSITRSGDDLVVTYKNEQVKRCLTKAGQVLEMIVYLYACRAAEDYNSVVNGAYLDWDGRPNANGSNADTRNEIDVLMMHYLQPVFVSCKNGDVKREELFMLHTVASRFGGGFAKKVLITTCLNQQKNAKFLRERAAELDITVIEPVEMTDADFEKKIRNLWRP
jgi:hypothetical protein